MGESRSKKLKYGSVSRHSKATMDAVEAAFPGFRGFCANCHCEMWADSTTRPRFGGICLQCAIRWEEGDWVSTATCGVRPSYSACSCCGRVKGKQRHGMCDPCTTIRRKPITSSKWFGEPECRNCAEIRRAQREALRDSA